jgi:hypothetical protein
MNSFAIFPQHIKDVNHIHKKKYPAYLIGDHDDGKLLGLRHWLGLLEFKYLNL